MSSSFHFDDQASSFDGRAGLPESAAREVARVVSELLSPGDGAGGEEGRRRHGTGPVLLDMGAGTGELGECLAVRVPLVGIDLSFPMLQEFARKLSGDVPSAPVLLAVADANRTWPIACRSVDGLFFSRAVHLMSPDHVASEVLRVTGRQLDSVVVLGRTKRSKKSVRSRMRRRMRDLLREEGIEGSLGGEGGVRTLVEELTRLSGEIQLSSGKSVVATWTVRETPNRSLESWRGKSGLAGTEVSEQIKKRVLDGTAVWAQEEFGSLDGEQVSEEGYELTWVRLSAKPDGGDSEGASR